MTLRRTLRAHWPLIGAVAVVVAGVVALLVGRVFSDRDAERRAVKAYADVIKPLAYDGGMIVQEGIKPGLDDLEAGKITPAVFRDRAQGWIKDMKRVRYGFRNAAHPHSLDRASDLYLASLDGYIRAMSQFIDASYLKGKAMLDALHAAVPTAEEADKTYDRARALLDKELKRLGLPTQA